jgi:hypothetical protein
MAIITPLKKIFNWQLASEKIPYRVYTALLTQVGTNAPTATILENTLGLTPNFEYANSGTYVWQFYTGTLNKAKTTFNCNWYSGTLSYTNTAFIGYESNWDTGVDAIVIRTFNGSILTNDVLGGGDPAFAGTLIEIKVYN